MNMELNTDLGTEVDYGRPWKTKLTNHTIKDTIPYTNFSTLFDVLYTKRDMPRYMSPALKKQHRVGGLTTALFVYVELSNVLRYHSLYVRLFTFYSYLKC